MARTTDEFIQWLYDRVQTEIDVSASDKQQIQQTLLDLSKYTPAGTTRTYTSKEMKNGKLITRVRTYRTTGGTGKLDIADRISTGIRERYDFQKEAEETTKIDTINEERQASKKEIDTLSLPSGVDDDLASQVDAVADEREGDIKKLQEETISAIRNELLPQAPTPEEAIEKAEAKIRNLRSLSDGISLPELKRRAEAGAKTEFRLNRRQLREIGMTSKQLRAAGYKV